MNKNANYLILIETHHITENGKTGQMWTLQREKFLMK